MRGNKDKRKQSTSDSYFNSRLYMRGNVVAHWEVQHEIISIHASTWEATYAPTLLNSQQLISIHASTWEATDLSANQYSALYISIHASTWEATPNALTTPNSPPCISIHASTWEATDVRSDSAWAILISIHASTWEATGAYHVPKFFATISIHASTWEATTSGLLSVFGNIFQFTPLHERQRDPKDKGSKNKYFNSRLYMRGNVNTSVDYWATYLISIHASTWEATLWQRWHTALHIISIHASTWEATEKGERTCWIYKFQFTPLHERQHCNLRTAGWYVVFQFTPLHERQHMYRIEYRTRRISIHASTWEATAEAAAETKEESISIHASTWEATRTEYGFSKDDDISIHASTWEATDATPAITWTQSISIHASTWEATISRDSIWLSVCYFNSRLYMRGNIVYFFLFLCL